MLQNTNAKRVAWLPVFIALSLLGVNPMAAAQVDYEATIKPLLKQRCASCHGSWKQEADLRLDAGALIPKEIRSEILKRVASTDESNRMPPEGARLTIEQIAALREWIEADAAFPKDEVIPTKPAEHWSFQPVKRSPIPNSRHEHPIDAFLFGQREASPQASAGTLLRRVHLDLIGLPPTIEEQDTFAADGKLESVIDALLTRPEYGERWARHWLDVARYADSNGYERDAEKPFVWRYRDYVIEAFNSDKPFNRFIMEQVAGDELADSNVETNVATGFLRVGPWDDQPGDPETDRYDQLDDVVSTTSQAFLGLTIGCARCHDHKLEPLSSRDYYSLVAIFNPLQRPHAGITDLAAKVGDTDVYAWQETSANAPETHILIRGSATRPGERVEPAVPAVLVQQQPAFDPNGERSTGRRLGLAKWIADESNPLTARLIVNRVWQQHFGEGIVSTASDFGLMGARPTHPELLDWLAHWFMHDAHWSIKKLHRMMLTSRAWQSRMSADSIVRYRRLEVEAIRDSMLFVSGRLNPKRFGSAFRPAIPLAAIEANSDKASIWKPSEEPEASRRSIYVFIKRGLIVPMLETFDIADTNSSCQKRQVTTVAPQALTLFNGEFTQQQARALAERLRREADNDVDRQISLAWRLALCREPTDGERTKLRDFIAQVSLEEFSRVVLNLNEFVYPE